AGVGADDATTLLANEAEERRVGVENRLKQRIEDLLANVVGDGRARVQVSAELDLTRTTRTSRTFDPESQVVRSAQTKESANSTNAPDADGHVSASTQLPGASATTGGTTQSELGSTTEEVTNYEISETNSTDMTDPGSIKRLSVAVVVDGTYTTD